MKVCNNRVVNWPVTAPTKVYFSQQHNKGSRTGWVGEGVLNSCGEQPIENNYVQSGADVRAMPLDIILLLNHNNWLSNCQEGEKKLAFGLISSPM